MKKAAAAAGLSPAKREWMLMEQVVEAFRAATGLKLEHLPDPLGTSDDALGRLALTISEGAAPRLYQPLVRKVERPEALGAVKAEIAACEEPAVLVTPKLSQALVQQCRELALPFLDGEGNAFLKDEGLLILVSGQKRVAATKVSRQRATIGRAGTPTGLQVVFALLSDPSLARATSQKLQAAVGVALGSVTAVLGDLEHQGKVVRIGWGKGWRVPDWNPLLDSWTKDYPLVLRPKLSSFRFRSPGQGLWWRQVDPQVYGGQWGGEVAASLLGTVLKPERTLLYLQPEAMRLGLAQLIKTQGLRKDPEGDVEVVEAFWSNERLGLVGATVPVPLVIADLLASLNTRNIEAALELRESWIRGVEA